MSLNLTTKNNIGVIAFDQVDSKMNILSSENLIKFDEVLEKVKGDSSLKALIILSKKKDCFIAGADIREIEQIVEANDGAAKAKAGQDLFNKIEDLKIPTIAVIDGVALGGGCELALACYYRVATFNPKVRIGVPEVNLGFVPGFGGTYRLPRVVGLSEGLTMILSGKPIDGLKALRVGLVDQLFSQVNLEIQILEYAQNIIDGNIKKKRYAPKKKRGPVGIMESNRLLHGVIFSESKKNVMKLSKGFYPAPLKAIDVIRQNYYCDRTKGLEIERKAFGELAVTDISKSLVNVFYLMEKYKKLSIDGTDGIEPEVINHCGVLGAGVMGGGIAQLLSSKDIWCRLKDINHDAIAKGYQSAAKVYSDAVKKRRLHKAVAAEKMAHITGTLDYSGFQNTDIVIEAVVEKMEVKKQVFKELSEVTNGKAILASNTSALSVTEMAKETKDPSRVIGFHFFNPVHRMPLVEVIKTDQTSKQTIVSALNLVKRLGKTAILVQDSPGFIVNRILLVYMAEAGRLLEECKDMIAIDRIMTDFGMPMGPFLLSDEVGLDVGLKVMRILEDAFGARYTPVKIFDKFFEKGDLGKKTGKGFYIHGKERSFNADVQTELSAYQRKNVELDDILKRMLYLMINEAAMCLEEGIVNEPQAIDVGMIFGTGFPPFRGGLLRYADSIGIKNIIADLEKYNKNTGLDYFKPCKYLLDVKEKGFYS